MSSAGWIHVFLSPQASVVMLTAGNLRLNRSSLHRYLCGRQHTNCVETLTPSRDSRASCARPLPVRTEGRLADWQTRENVSRRALTCEFAHLKLRPTPRT